MLSAGEVHRLKLGFRALIDPFNLMQDLVNLLMSSGCVNNLVSQGEAGGESADRFAKAVACLGDQYLLMPHDVSDIVHELELLRVGLVGEEGPFSVSWPLSVDR